MKHLLLSLFLLLNTTFSFGQTLFLGVPVDGTKAQFYAKLKTKGFVYSSTYKGYIGKFNGRSVIVNAVTNQESKIWRVMVQSQKWMSDNDVEQYYNSLISDFLRSTKYEKEYVTYTDDELSTNLWLSKKTYESSFWQNGDSDKNVWFTITSQGENSFHYDVLLYYDNVLNKPDYSPDL